MQARTPCWAERLRARGDTPPTTGAVVVAVAKPSARESAHRSAGWGRSAGAAAQKTSGCAQMTVGAAQTSRTASAAVAAAAGRAARIPAVQPASAAASQAPYRMTWAVRRRGQVWVMGGGRTGAPGRWRMRTRVSAHASVGRDQAREGRRACRKVCAAMRGCLMMWMRPSPGPCRRPSSPSPSSSARRVVRGKGRARHGSGYDDGWGVREP